MGDTRVVDRYGRPHQTREVRRRMGFLGGDELEVEGETMTFQQPAFSMPASNRTADGDDEPPFFGDRK